MADHVIRPVEASALVVVDQRLDLAVRAHPGQAAVVSFADDQPPLQVEGRAVAPNRCPDEFRLSAGNQPMQMVAVKIDKIPIAVRVPERSFREDETCGQTLGIGGFENLGQVIVYRHSYSSFLACHAQVAIAAAMTR